MRRFYCFLVAVCLLAVLTACGGEVPAGTAELGRYDCGELSLENLPLETEDVWVELKEEGALSIFLNGEERNGRWTLEGDAFALKLSDGTRGTGTLSGGVLDLDLGSIHGTFAQEGARPAQSETTTTTFSCGGLYYVDYDTRVFAANPSHLSDLLGVETDSRGWITKLTSKEMVEQWLAAFEARRTDGTVGYETRDLTVAGYPTRAIVYQDNTGFHSEILVNFGTDMGSRKQPMWAAYLCFNGGTREDVWNEAVQGMLSSLRLG